MPPSSIEAPNNENRNIHEKNSNALDCERLFNLKCSLESLLFHFFQDISHNELDNVPAALEKAKGLLVLNLSHNK